MLAITVKAFFSVRYFLRKGEVDDSNFFIGHKDNLCIYLKKLFSKKLLDSSCPRVAGFLRGYRYNSFLKNFEYVSYCKEQNKSCKSETIPKE